MRAWARSSRRPESDHPRFPTRADAIAVRGAPARIDVCPYAHPTLIEGLARRGFSLSELELTLGRALGRDGKDDLEGSLEAASPAGLEIVPVDTGDPGQVRAFVEASASGFRPAGEVDGSAADART